MSDDNLHPVAAAARAALVAYPDNPAAIERDDAYAVSVPRETVERVEPVVAGTTLREAYLAASARHFPFSGKMPAELPHMGSYAFEPQSFPDPKGMLRRIREKGWKSMIWTAHFVSPDRREYKLLRDVPLDRLPRYERM